MFICGLFLRFRVFLRFNKRVGFFIVTVRAVSAPTFTAVSTFQMILLGEYFIALFVIIKVFVFFDDFLMHKLKWAAEINIFVK